MVYELFFLGLLTKFYRSVKKYELRTTYMVALWNAYHPYDHSVAIARYSGKIGTVLDYA